ncbi:protein of unknown function [Mesotoga infera]|uniref:Uncharacterized protein n=1 Tax=Mesotoga infera TaxID=1236046 RepID=A0A7Z7LFZ2_9BACT|nr:protein of unknown function [Mesotoga infera]
MISEMTYREIYKLGHMIDTYVSIEYV